MKKTIYIVLMPLLAFATLCLLHACKKDYPSRTVEISYPTVTLVGPQDTTLSRNATWKDPGATWVDSVTGEHGAITFPIVTTTDSAYYLLYVATNKNGFISNNNPANLAPVYRAVAVTNISASADISGAYTLNGAFGPTPDTLVKVSRGLFYTSNVDGYFDPGVITVKSDSSISVATILPEAVGWATNAFVTYVTPATVPVTFDSTAITYQAPFYYTGTPPHIVYQPPVIISYQGLVTNDPAPIPVILTHN